MLPKIIKIACMIEIIGLVSQGVMAPFYEQDINRFTAPLTLAGMVVLFFLFLRRYRWTWLFVQVFTIVSPIMSAIFPPTEKDFGFLITPARISIAIQSLACLVVFVTMFFAATRRWFFRLENTDANDPNFHKGEIVEVTYEKTFLDILWFNIYQPLRTPRMYIFLGGLLTAVAFFILLSLSDSPYPLWIKIITCVVLITPIFLGLILLSFLAIVFGHLFIKIKYRGKSQNCTLSVSESGIVSESVSGRSQLTWSKISKVRQTHRYILIYLSHQSAFLIPKRVFADSTKAEQFFEAAQRFWENQRVALP